MNPGAKDDGEKVRITVTIDAGTAAKISELAGRMQTTESRMASWLLEQGLEDNSWIIKVVTSNVVQGLGNALRGKGKKRNTEKG